MDGKWELVKGSDNIRHTGGGYQLVLESLTRGASEMAGPMLSSLVEKLNREVCKCGKACDFTGYCDDCFGG